MAVSTQAWLAEQRRERTAAARRREGTVPPSLGDVENVEAFVEDIIDRISGDPGIAIEPHEREDVFAEGLAILVRLYDRFEPHREGYAQAGRFSGYAARYLPAKLKDAWRAMHPNHLVRVTDGRRTWEVLPAAESLDVLRERDVEPKGARTGKRRSRGESDRDENGNGFIPLAPPDQEDHLLAMIGTALVSVPSLQSRVARAIGVGVRSQLEAEHFLTIQVGILKGMDMHRSEIATVLQVDELDVQMALLRLKRIGKDFNGAG